MINGKRREEKRSPLTPFEIWGITKKSFPT
jgi:hypothetical protein